jgi:hypothetical protein
LMFHFNSLYLQSQLMGTLYAFKVNFDLAVPQIRIYYTF